MSDSAYDQYVYRHPFARVRRACLNTPALIAYDQLREDYKQRIKDKYFNGDEPYIYVKHHQFRDLIIPDQKAREFYANYVLDDGRRLPQEAQNEYSTNAAILNAIYKLTTDNSAMRKAMGGKRINLMEKVSEVVNSLNLEIYKHSLPTKPIPLSRTLKEYLQFGYGCLVSGKWGNRNTEKLNEVGKAWMLARWMNQVDRCASEQQLMDEYNQYAKEKGWKTVKIGAVHNYLHQPQIKELWEGYRYGELKAKETHSLQFSTQLPSMRDSLWYSDGTKLNYYYMKVVERDGKSISTISTCNVYEVIDTYSEKLLGYCISDSEDYQTQYTAYKMAMKTSGYKPFEIKFDNQGGHRKLMSGDFFKKLAHVAINTQPYNGKSKTIESIFGRFQSQILKKDWFFTGQNITTKRDESHANMEFIMANAANLPTFEEVKAIYAKRREEWNNAPHPIIGVSRNEMYYSSHNPQTCKIELHDMVDMFWITRQKPITLDGRGLHFEEKKVEYEYLVYSEPMKPNHAWHSANIGRQFIVKFDPDDMSMVQLFTQDTSGLRYVTTAETKIVVQRGMQEQQGWERSWIAEQINEVKANRINIKEKAEAILEQHGMLPEQQGMNSAPLKGIESSRKKRTKMAKDIAEVQKEISNKVEIDDSCFDERDLYSNY